MTTTSTMTGSPLSAIAGLGSLGVGMFQKTGSVPVLDAAGKPMLDAAGKILMTPGTTPASNIGSTVSDIWKYLSSSGAAPTTDTADGTSGNSGGNFGGGFGDGTTDTSTETPTLGAGSWEQDQDGTWTFVPA
jgi:hypothetical protein